MKVLHIHYQKNIYFCYKLTHLATGQPFLVFPSFFVYFICRVYLFNIKTKINYSIIAKNIAEKSNYKTILIA